VPNVRLTDISLRSLPSPERGQVDYWDQLLPCFGCRVSQGGTKTFILKKDNRRISIGRFPVISLTQARTEAKRLLAEHTLGQLRARPISIAAAREEFLADCARKNRVRTVADYRRLLTKYLSFKDALQEVSHSDITRRLNRIGAPSERNHALVAGKVFFNWAVKKRYLSDNPVEGATQHATVARSRVLSDEEIRAIWLACDGVFGTIVKLLILTGQRRGEIAALRREWIDPAKRVITLPASITKNRREHLLTYGTLVSDLLDAVPATVGLLFPARGKDTPFNGFGKCKLALDNRARIEPWTLHDIRRTFATNLAALGTAPHVVERLLNHASGTISGVAAIYNRFQYMDEMRAAIALWEQHLGSLLSHPTRPGIASRDAP
jgi:integrase